MANGNNEVQAEGIGRGWKITGAVILVLIIAAVLFQFLRPRRIRVTVTKPSRMDITSTISTNGRVEPVRNFEAHAPIGTTVRRVHVKEGDRVHKGQLLVQLDDADARAQLAKARAQLAASTSGGRDIQVQNASTQADLSKARNELDQAQRNYAALQRLLERGAASQQEVDAARNRVDQAKSSLAVLQDKANTQSVQVNNDRATAEIANARAAVSAAEQMVADSNITAPFDGTVYSVPVRDGAFVAAGDLIVQMADLKQMQVRAFVDEPEIGKLQQGQQVRITWEALPSRMWDGKVTTVPTTVVNRGNRVVGELICSVEKTDLALLPNVNVGVTIVVASHPQALILPREAVHEENGKNYVYVVKPDMHLDRREVDLGVANLTSVEIKSGVNEGETVAVNSLSPSPLTDGIWVRIMEQS